MANKTIKTVQTQLDSLLSTCPDLNTTKQWGKIQQELQQLSHHINRRERFLEAATAISNTVNSSIGLDELLAVAIDQIKNSADLYYVGVFLLDEAANQAVLQANSHPTDNREAYRLDVTNESTVGWVINNQRLRLSKSGKKKPVWFKHEQLPDTGSEAAIPLVARAGVIGVLVIQSTQANAFSKNDAQALQTIGDQLANAVQNVTLFATADEQLEQLAALHNINLQLNHYLTLDTLLNAVAQLGAKLLNTNGAIVRFLDKDDEQTLTVSAVYNPPKGIKVGQTQKLGSGVSGQVIENHQAVLANNWPDYAAEHGFSTEPDNTLALLNVPIAIQGKIIGTIELHDTTRLYAFDENDRYTLSLLGSQAGAAIERMQLFNQVENNQRFLKTIIEHIPDPIFIKDKNHTWIEMNQANANVIGRPEEELIGKTDKLFFPPELADEFYRRDNDVLSANKIYEHEDKTVWGDGREHIAYTRLIPLPGASGKPEYILGLTHDVTERKAYEAEREHHLAEMAAMYKGSQAIARALSERQVFNALFEQIRLEDPCEIVAFRFHMVHNEPIWADIKATWQKKNTPSYVTGTRFYLPETAQAHLLTTNDPMFIEDIATDERISDEERKSFEPTGAVSVAIIPINFIGQEIGAVLIYFTFRRTFSDNTKRFWIAMIDQARVALSNQQLLQGSIYRVVQMETAAEVARAASSLVELNELLNSAVALIRDRFHLYYVGAFLLDKTKAWAVLRAGTGQAGRTQLAKNHRLKINDESMIGWSIQHRQPRIALDVGREAVHFQNPDLPDTRSELALPLIYHNEAIGAITVQSEEAAAFSQEDVVFLQTMADQLANAIENARLFEQMQSSLAKRQQAEEDLLKALERTESLYRIGDSISAVTDQKTLFQTVLGEYLRLLGLQWGALFLLDKHREYGQTQVMILDGNVTAKDTVSISIEKDPLFHHLLKESAPLAIGDVYTHPFTKDNRNFRKKFKAKSILYTPIIMRKQIMGIIMAGTIEKDYAFSQGDIEISQAVSDQLAIWLENRELLTEAEYRSERLQTAAEVSRAAGSILDMNELIETSVNYIRDQFKFYYVGLFIVDEKKKWAVLRAGTGQAGQIQLENNHRLEIGGESMIGWSVANRKARIALDVGAEKVRFKNPILPDTHSEMALPLISRDEVIGALTVQSVERGAFSDEDITLLQTMADQLANAIENARLFENAARAQQEAEARLQETSALQILSRNLAGTLNVDQILDVFFTACTGEIGFEYAIFSLVDKYQNRIRAISGIGVSQSNIARANYTLDSHDIMVDIIKTGKTEIITGWDDRFNKEIFEAENHAGWIRIFTPVTLRGENIGLVEAGFNKITQSDIKESQIRLLRAFINQTALAFDNAQRYEASQKAARREALIKEITTKVRASTDLDTILKTTVEEVGNAISNKRAYIHLISPQETAAPGKTNGNPKAGIKA